MLETLITAGTYVHMPTSSWVSFFSQSNFMTWYNSTETHCCSRHTVEFEMRLDSWGNQWRSVRIYVHISIYAEQDVASKAKSLILDLYAVDTGPNFIYVCMFVLRRSLSNSNLHLNTFNCAYGIDSFRVRSIFIRWVAYWSFVVVCLCCAYVRMYVAIQPTHSPPSV